MPSKFRCLLDKIDELFQKTKELEKELDKKIVKYITFDDLPRDLLPNTTFSFYSIGQNLKTAMSSSSVFSALSRLSNDMDSQSDIDTITFDYVQIGNAMSSALNTLFVPNGYAQRFVMVDSAGALLFDSFQPNISIYDSSTNTAFQVRLNPSSTLGVPALTPLYHLVFKPIYIASIVPDSRNSGIAPSAYLTYFLQELEFQKAVIQDIGYVGRYDVNVESYVYSVVSRVPLSRGTINPYEREMLFFRLSFVKLLTQ